MSRTLPERKEEDLRYESRRTSTTTILILTMTFLLVQALLFLVLLPPRTSLGTERQRSSDWTASELRILRSLLDRKLETGAARPVEQRR